MLSHFTEKDLTPRYAVSSISHSPNSFDNMLETLERIGNENAVLNDLLVKKCFELEETKRKMNTLFGHQMKSLARFEKDFESDENLPSARMTEYVESAKYMQDVIGRPDKHGYIKRVKKVLNQLPIK